MPLIIISKREATTLLHCIKYAVRELEQVQQTSALSSSYLDDIITEMGWLKDLIAQVKGTAHLDIKRSALVHAVRVTNHMRALLNTDDSDTPPHHEPFLTAAFVEVTELHAKLLEAHNPTPTKEA